MSCRRKTDSRSSRLSRRSASSSRTCASERTTHIAVRIAVRHTIRSVVMILTRGPLQKEPSRVFTFRITYLRFATCRSESAAKRLKRAQACVRTPRAHDGAQRLCGPSGANAPRSANHRVKRCASLLPNLHILKGAEIATQPGRRKTLSRALRECCACERLPELPAHTSSILNCVGAKTHRTPELRGRAASVNREAFRLTFQWFATCRSESGVLRLKRALHLLKQRGTSLMRASRGTP